MAVTATLVPTATDALPASFKLQRTPSAARSSTHVVPAADALTALTVRFAPEARTATGAVESKPIGKAESALASDACACASAAKQAMTMEAKIERAEAMDMCAPGVRS